MVISSITPGETAKASLKLCLPPSLPTSTLTIPFGMDYAGGGGGGAGGGDLLLVPSSPARAKKEGGGLMLPACVFLRPGRLSPSGFMSLLSQGQVQWHEASVRLPLRGSSKKRGGGGGGGGGFEAVVAHLSTFFQAQIVETTPPAAAALYATVGGGREGGQAQQHHVALLAKFVGGGEVVEVALKSDLPGLARALAGEAEALCTF